MAYTTFTGKDGSQANFPWVTQKIGGVDAMVLVLDVNGAPLATANPLPITAPSAIPVSGTVAVIGTTPVSIAATVNTVTPVDSAPVSRGGTTVGTASAPLIAQNLTRKRIDVSNWSTTAQLAIRFGATAAVIGQDELLPPQAQATYYCTSAIQVIASAASTSYSFVEW